MSDRATIAAIRFGYGLPLSDAAPTDLASDLAADPAALLAGPDLAAWEWPGVGLAQALPLYRVAAAARRQMQRADTGQDATGQGAVGRKAHRAALRAVRLQGLEAARVTLARAVGSPDGFRERLVQFWADHFTAVGRFRQDAALPPALVEDAIRPHVAGRFGDMLKAAVLHPAMLMYLDQVQSIGPASPVGQRRGRGLNENLARELIELHTLGVGAAYSQTDVTEMAELLTGLRFDPGFGTDFEPRWAEPGPERVLGRVYAGPGAAPVLAALDDLAVRPETARHIARKLAVHFVADQPDEALVSALAARFSATGGDLLAVYRVLLDHPAAWRLPLVKARQPFDFMVASLRALGLSGADVLRFGDGKLRRMILLPMEAMGQPWQQPGGPDGWPEEAEAWISPLGLAARIGWAMEVPGRLVPVMPDPRAFALRALGPLAGGRLLWAAAAAESLREGVGLVLASAEFNRR